MKGLFVVAVLIAASVVAAPVAADTVRDQLERGFAWLEQGTADSVEQARRIFDSLKTAELEIDKAAAALGRAVVILKQGKDNAVGFAALELRQADSLNLAIVHFLRGVALSRSSPPTPKEAESAFEEAARLDPAWAGVDRFAPAWTPASLPRAPAVTAPKPPAAPEPEVATVPLPPPTPAPRPAEESSPVHEVTAEYLHLRSSPGTDPDTEKGILKKGDRVQILHPRNEKWISVKVLWSERKELRGLEGWVSKSYLQPYLPVFVVVAKSSLNARSEPREVDETKLGALVSGDRVEALGEPLDGWRHVRVLSDAADRLSGQEVWVSADYIRPEGRGDSGPAPAASAPREAASPPPDKVASESKPTPDPVAGAPGTDAPPPIRTGHLAAPGQPEIPDGCERLPATSAIKVPVFPLTRLWPTLPGTPVDTAEVYELGDVMKPAPETVAPTSRCRTNESHGSFWGIRVPDGTIRYAAPVIVVTDKSIEVRRGIEAPTDLVGSLGTGDAVELSLSAKGFPAVKKESSYVRILRSKGNLSIVEGDFYWIIVPDTWWSSEDSNHSTKVDGRRVGETRPPTSRDYTLVVDAELRSEASAVLGDVVRRIKAHQVVELLDDALGGRWARVRMWEKGNTVDGWISSNALERVSSGGVVPAGGGSGNAAASDEVSCREFHKVVNNASHEFKKLQSYIGVYIWLQGRWIYNEPRMNIGIGSDTIIMGYCVGPVYDNDNGEVKDGSYAIIKLRESQMVNFQHLSEESKKYFLVRNEPRTFQDQRR